MARFFAEPLPNKEAIAFIATLPPLVRDVYDELLPELKALSFTITGIHSADVLQAARDALAKLPAGEDAEAVKAEVMAAINPYFKDPQAAARRAELLLRHWGGIAYASAQYRVMDRQRKLFPFWQYVTMGDGKVRATHRALSGIVLPHDSPFWQRHYPPWAPFCRCQVIPLSRSDVEDLRAADSDKPEDERLVIDGAVRRKLETENTLVRGPSMIYDTSPPEDKPVTLDLAPPESWRGFDPMSLKVDQAFLADRYSPDVLGKFMAWAGGIDLGGGLNLAGWISGRTRS